MSNDGPCSAREEPKRDVLASEGLLVRLTALEREHQRVCDAYARLEAQVAEMASFCVVMERLHDVLDHREVLAGVQDVVINVIGSEELAIFEPSHDARELIPVQCFGVEQRGLRPVRWGEGFIGRAAAEGRGWTVCEGLPPAEWSDLTACVPFRAGDRVVAVLAIWRMLAHKPNFGETDRRVLELLARHGASALHLTSIREPPQRRVPEGSREP